MRVTLKKQAPEIANTTVVQDGINVQYSLRADYTVLVCRKAYGKWQPWKAIPTVDIDPIFNAKDLEAYAVGRWPMAAVYTISFF
jgi:hypothetical protein